VLPGGSPCCSVRLPRRSRPWHWTVRCSCT
jgi:hypothetical protein